MITSRLLIWLLILASVLVDGVVWTLVGRGNESGVLSLPRPAIGLLFSLVFSQVSLAAVWAGLSGRTIAWRLAGGLLVVLLWSVALSVLGGGDIAGGSTQWIVLLSGQAMTVFVPLSVARGRGVRLSEASVIDTTSQQGVELRSWQFSLQCWFAWMAALAVAMGMVCSVDREHLPWTPHFWLSAGILLVGHSATAIVALWAVLGTGRPMRRIVGICLTVAVVLAVYMLTANTRGHMQLRATLCLAQATLLIGSLWVARTAGYRLTSQKRGHSTYMEKVE